MSKHSRKLGSHKTLTRSLQKVVPLLEKYGESIPEDIVSKSQKKAIDFLIYCGVLEQENDEN